MALAKYSFLPWFRQGIANNITTASGASGIRAKIPVTLKIKVDGKFISNENTIDTAKDVVTDVSLIGPGDITGISQKAIVKTHPLNWITDFEPNYLPFVEFYDEDFAWRYTPLKATTSTKQLKPWITLIVLKDDEFSENKKVSTPLPSIKINNPDQVMPPHSQLWAWAHVHINKDLSGNNIQAVLSKLETEINKNPDVAYSRIFCPRELSPNTAYHAFLVPSFESGRLAGMGEDVTTATSVDQPAWGTDSPGKTDFPYYYKWYFRTGTEGDFEYLVRLLKPGPVDDTVGIRDMDVQEPGSGIDGITTPPALGLMGALKAPQTKPTNWPAPHPDDFQKDLAERINLSKNYQITGVSGGDPIITPPLYGRWHSLTDTLDANATTWVHELNLDPRNRVPAGFGTKVVKENQEAYMNEAWRQVGDILEANKKLQFAQFSREISWWIYNQNIKTLQDDAFLQITSLVQPKVLASAEMETDGTVYFHIQQSATPATVFNPAFRKLTRPRGALMKRVDPDGPRRPTNLVQQIAEGKISATPPKKKAPDTALTIEDLKDRVDPGFLPEWLERLLSKWWFRWLPFFLLVLLLIIAILLGVGLTSSVVVGVIALILLVLNVLFGQWWRRVNAHNTFKPDTFTPEGVKRLNKNPEFRILEIGEPGTQWSFAGTDSTEAANFKQALVDLHTMFATKPPEPEEKPKLNLGVVTQTLIVALNPLISIPNRIVTLVSTPGVLYAVLEEWIRPAMAYPEFPQPMYEPLRDISVELLIPNINLIPQNTISLLETNQKFIESYMVGLNHEMGRELHWREYPTDQRGSYFRQFWDVSEYVNFDDTLTEKQLAEKLKDIKPIHTWKRSDDLGDHNNREQGGDKSQLVLVVRGDLFKKYPNTVVYAWKADWTRKEGNGAIDHTKPRKLVTGDPKTVTKFPLYGAKVYPDIHFFGFDLTAPQARGGSGQNDTDDAGWFFVLEERPGEPRFGLDTTDTASPPPPATWNDLTWNHVQKEAGHIKLGAAIIVPGAANPEGVAWSQATTSADLAYILYQDPMRIAVHASDMLK